MLQNNWTRSPEHLNSLVSCKDHAIQAYHSVHLPMLGENLATVKLVSIVTLPIVWILTFLIETVLLSSNCHTAFSCIAHWRIWRVSIDPADQIDMRTIRPPQIFSNTCIDDSGFGRKNHTKSPVLLQICEHAVRSTLVDFLSKLYPL